MAKNNIEEFFTAVLNNDIQKVVGLVKEQGVDVDSPDEHNFQKTALHKAAEKGYLEMVHVLVDELGADVNVDDSLGIYPMHRASEAGFMEIVKYLMDKRTHFSEFLRSYLNDIRFL